MTYSFIKDSQETDTSFTDFYVPLLPFNFHMVAVFTQKEPPEGERPLKKIIFESANTIQDIRQVQSNVKVIKGQVVPTMKLEPVSLPYQVVITDQEKIEKIIEWLESNVII